MLISCNLTLIFKLICLFVLFVFYSSFISTLFNFSIIVVIQKTAEISFSILEEEVNKDINDILFTLNHGFVSVWIVLYQCTNLLSTNHIYLGLFMFKGLRFLLQIIVIKTNKDKFKFYDKIDKQKQNKFNIFEYEIFPGCL